MPFAGLGSWVALGKRIRVSSAFCLRLRANHAQKLETIRSSSETGRETATSPVTPVISSNRDVGNESVPPNRLQGVSERGCIHY
jgi:hypothetical protein